MILKNIFKPIRNIRFIDLCSICTNYGAKLDRVQHNQCLVHLLRGKVGRLVEIAPQPQQPGRAACSGKRAESAEWRSMSFIVRALWQVEVFLGQDWRSGGAGAMPSPSAFVSVMEAG